MKKPQGRTTKIIIADEKDDAPKYKQMLDDQQTEMIDKIKKRNEVKFVEACLQPTTPKKPYPLTKKIGLAVLVVTECMVVAVFGWSSYTKQLQEAFDAVGYQMIIFAAFWGVKAVADNIKSMRGQ